MVSREEFNKVFKDTSKEGILNQFYYEHYELLRIKKEVREYINNHQLVFEMSSKKQIAYWFDMFYKELLEILDKAGDEK